MNRCDDDDDDDDDDDPVTVAAADEHDHDGDADEHMLFEIVFGAVGIWIRITWSLPYTAFSICLSAYNCT